MTNLIGKRFLFGCLAILCVSVVSGYLKYPAEIYVTLVTSITAMFMTSQTTNPSGPTNGGNQNDTNEKK